MAARRFRRDLYYRLNVLPIAVPPLRDRGDDLVSLARAFLAEAEAEVGRSGLSFADDALGAMRAHPWPGNVRELRNVVLRAAATARTESIHAADLALDPAGAADLGRPPAALVDAARPLRATVLATEREALVAALAASGWNCARAAASLGISRMTLYRRLKRLGLTRNEGCAGGSG
jgi:two-component system NtrC family response regulator